jgi:hypothetical protein
MKRWVRFHLPVMVLVDVSDTVEDERILQIVGCTEEVRPAEDLDGQLLMYDTEMQHVAAGSSANQPCLSAARHLSWPPASDWEFAEDPLKVPYLYDPSYDAFADLADLLDEKDLEDEDEEAPPRTA